MSEVRPDEFYPLNIENTDRGYIVNAKYDRIDSFSWLGHYILKVFDDEQGLVSMHVSEDTARAIIEYSEIPLVEREFIYQSEYDGYLESQQRAMDEWTE